MLKRLLVVFVLGSLVLVQRPCAAATPEEVASAISKAQDYLFSKQNAQGNWEESPAREGSENASPKGGQWGGVTALVTYALLASGESPQEAKLQSAIKFLKKADIIGVYAAGLRSQVWTFLPDDGERKRAVVQDLEILQRAALTAKNNAGLFDYLSPAKPGDARVDHSVSQYGVLGLWALDRVGANVDMAFWQAVENSWKSHQDPKSGGWCYADKPSPDRGATIPMTAAGIATLFITQDYLHADEGIQPRGNITNPSIERGMKWMRDNFDPSKTSPYAWYGIERIGVASGYKYFGKHDWYAMGADHLVKTQHGGAWGGGVVDSSFCLVFLSRGRAPVMMNKLQYSISDAKGKSVEGAWNQRPRDVANLARWVGHRVERDLNWQIVNLEVPAEELVESPILYISGSGPLTLSDSDKAKLRQYVEDGGMLFFNPDGGKPTATDAFKKLGEELFPKYKFRELPEGSPIYTNQQFQRSKWRTKPPVQSLSNGAREMMITVPVLDCGRYWQTDDQKRPELYQLPTDIFLYSVDRQNIQYKGERKVTKPDAKVQASATITVARLEYDGNWNPEPGGWRRLAAVMHNDDKTDLKISTVKLGEGKLNSTFAVAHLTGTGAIKLDDKAKAELKDYVEKGGTLIIDAAGGDSAFATAMEAELAGVFGGDAAKAVSAPLPNDSPLYAAMGIGNDTIEYRSYVRVRLGQSPKGPRLRAIDINGKPKVIYSPEDLSVGLMGQPVDGIHGYSPRTATALMSGLIRNAAK